MNRFNSVCQEHLGMRIQRCWWPHLLSFYQYSLWWSQQFTQDWWRYILNSHFQCFLSLCYLFISFELIQALTYRKRLFMFCKRDNTYAALPILKLFKKIFENKWYLAFVNFLHVGWKQIVLKSFITLMDVWCKSCYAI